MNFWLGFLCGVSFYASFICVFHWLNVRRTRRKIEAQKHINGIDEEVP